MPYNAAEFRAKTSEILQAITTKQVLNKGYTDSIYFLPPADVADLITYINANPNDVRTFGYEQQGETLFIKPKLPLKIELKRI
jgi:hypothetical protein